MSIDRYAQQIAAATKTKVKAKAARPREKKPTITPTPWDMGATGPANQKGLVQEDAPHIDPETGKESNPNGVKRMRRAPWIVTYANKGKLTPRQFNVADAIYRASQGKLSEDPLAALVTVRVPGGSDPQAAAVDRRRAFFRLMKLVPDYARPVIERVVVNNEPVWKGNTAQRERHMTRLQEGLDHVANLLDGTKP